jgi:hypothetical protein
MERNVPEGWKDQRALCGEMQRRSTRHRRGEIVLKSVKSLHIRASGGSLNLTSLEGKGSVDSNLSKRETLFISLSSETWTAITHSSEKTRLTNQAWNTRHHLDEEDRTTTTAFNRHILLPRTMALYQGK